MQSLQASSSEEDLISHTFLGILFGQPAFSSPRHDRRSEILSVPMMDTREQGLSAAFAMSQREDFSLQHLVILQDNTQCSCILFSLVHFLSCLYVACKAGIKFQGMLMGFQTLGLHGVFLFPTVLLLRKTAVYATAIFHPEFYVSSACDFKQKPG